MELHNQLEETAKPHPQYEHTGNTTDTIDATDGQN